MSEWGKTPKDAFTDKRLTLRDVRVFGVICNHADGKTGLCTVKQATIADEIKSDRVGVLRSLKKLVELGYLTAHQRPGMRRSLQYRVLIPDRAAGQMSLFDSEAAPRQAKSRPAKGGRKATSDVAHEATSDVALEATPLEQTLVNREPAGSAVLREREADRTQSPEQVPPRTVDQADAVPPVDGSPRLRSVADTDQLAARLRDAAGGAINAAHPAFLNLSEPFGWLAAGCDLDLDVVPVLRSFAGRHTELPCRTWRYFAGAVLEARDRRLSFAARLPTNVVPFDPRGARHEPSRDEPSFRSRGRLSTGFDHYRHLLEGGGAGGSDG